MKGEGSTQEHEKLELSVSWGITGNQGSNRKSESRARLREKSNEYVLHCPRKV